MKNILALTGLISAAILVILHRFALTFFWYWNFKWFDVPMHFLGGFVVGILMIYIATLIEGERLWRTDNHAFWIVFLPLLVIGISWEVFELGFGIETYTRGYISDTLIDLGMDLIGGLVAFLGVQKFYRQSNQISS